MMNLGKAIAYETAHKKLEDEGDKGTAIPA